METTISTEKDNAYLKGFIAKVRARDVMGMKQFIFSNF